MQTNNSYQVVKCAPHNHPACRHCAEALYREKFGKRFKVYIVADQFLTAAGLDGSYDDAQQALEHVNRKAQTLGPNGRAWAWDSRANKYVTAAQ